MRVRVTDVLRRLAVIASAAMCVATAGCSSVSSAGSLIQQPAGVTEAATDAPAASAAPVQATTAPSQTPVPTATAIDTPTPTLLPPTATATASPTPVPARLVQLTEGGCCTQPVWAPDSQRVLFIDKPDPRSPSGLYAVEIAKPLAPPRLFLETLGIYSRDYALRAAVQDHISTFIERVADGKRWPVNNGGRSVNFSPDSKLLSWSISEEVGILSDRRSEVWIANVDGTGSRRVLTGLIGGGFSGWLPDSSGFLYSWRETVSSLERVVSLYPLAGGPPTELVRAERFGSLALSPEAGWLAYTVSLASNAAQDGMYLVNVRERTTRKLDWTASFQWRDENHLLYIPFRATPAEPFQLYEFDARTGTSRRLFEPADLGLWIANGDWRVSPDGHSLVFVSAQDHNLYLVLLP